MRLCCTAVAPPAPSPCSYPVAAPSTCCSTLVSSRSALSGSLASSLVLASALRTRLCLSRFSSCAGSSTSYASDSSPRRRDRRLSAHPIPAVSNVADADAVSNLLPAISASLSLPAISVVVSCSACIHHAISFFNPFPCSLTFPSHPATTTAAALNLSSA